MTTNPVDPGDIRTFKLDYSELLAQLGNATISESTWEVPDDLAIITDSEANDELTTSIKLDFTNAKLGYNYTCYNRIVTDGGDARRRAMIIPVRDAATFSAASTTKATLDAIRAAMAGRATAAQQSRTIGNTTIQFMTMADLLIAETRWQQLYNQEVRAERLRSGEPAFKTIHTRFLPPS